MANPSDEQLVDRAIDATDNGSFCECHNVDPHEFGRVLIQAVRAERDAEFAAIGPARLTEDESRRLESRLCAHGGAVEISVADRLVLAVCLERLRRYEKLQPPPAATPPCPECGGVVGCTRCVYASIPSAGGTVK